MPTDVQLVNQALVEVAQDPIASLAGTDEVSLACASIYADTRDAVLLLYPWHFATYQIGLPVSAFPAVFKWGHQYALPDGVKYGGAPYCLKVLETSEGTGATWELASHTVDGRILYTHPLALGAEALDALALVPYGIAYTGRVTDLSLWDALALRVLVKLLASTLAKAMTGQSALADEKLKEALALLPAGQKEQGEQGHPIGLFPGLDVLESPLRVVNQALGRIGQEPIRSMTEDTKAGYQVRLHYATAQAAVLTRHPWNFAKCQATLTLSPTYVPPLTWSNAFDLPDGGKYGGKPYCLSVQGVAEDNGGHWEVTNDTTAPWIQGVTTGKVLLTRCNQATIEYTGLITNLAIWNPLAVEALSCLLASRLAVPLAANPQLRLALHQEAMVTIGDAKRLDGLEGTPIRLRPNALLVGVRGGAGYGAPIRPRGIWLPPATDSVSPVPGRGFGLASATLYAIDAVEGGARLVAPALLPAGTRVSNVVYQCVTTFGTTLGLLGVDIGEASLQDRWGHNVGIVHGVSTGYGSGLGGDLEVQTNGDVWVTALGGLFDPVGACTLYALWEIQVLS